MGNERKLSDGEIVEMMNLAKARLLQDEQIIVHEYGVKLFEKKVREEFEQSELSYILNKETSKFCNWAKAKIHEYFLSQIDPWRIEAFDCWGFEPWEFDLNSGKFVGKLSNKEYAELLIKEFFETVKIEKEIRVEQYMEPWELLMENYEAMRA